LQDIYNGRRPFDPQRVRAGALAIAYESPKLAVIGHVAEDRTFAERLERALARSHKGKLIEHRAKGE
jgi:hypothetical protein